MSTKIKDLLFLKKLSIGSCRKETQLSRVKIVCLGLALPQLHWKMFVCHVMEIAVVKCQNYYEIIWGKCFIHNNLFIMFLYSREFACQMNLRFNCKETTLFILKEAMKTLWGGWEISSIFLMAKWDLIFWWRSPILAFLWEANHYPNLHCILFSVSLTR